MYNMERTCGSLIEWVKGDAVWKTPSQPATTASNEPSSNRFALNKWSLSLAPSIASKCSVFFGSSEEDHLNYFWH